MPIRTQPIDPWDYHGARPLVHGPDGRRLLLRTHGGTERPGHLDVIPDWDVELARKMAEAHQE